MSWTYRKKLFTDPKKYYGFVYIITNNINNKKYLGKKFFWSQKTRPPLKGKKNKRREKVLSDWLEYWGSNDELKSDIEKHGKENFSREIIHLCKTKGITNYLEAKEQFKKSVLEKEDLWYNTWIMVRVNRSHIKNK